MRESFRRSMRVFRVPVFGFFAALGGGILVFIAQYAGSALLETVGAVIALGGMAVVTLGLVWYAIHVLGEIATARRRGQQ